MIPTKPSSTQSANRTTRNKAGMAMASRAPVKDMAKMADTGKNATNSKGKIGRAQEGASAKKQSRNGC